MYKLRGERASSGVFFILLWGDNGDGEGAPGTAPRWASAARRQEARSHVGDGQLQGLSDKSDNSVTPPKNHH